MKHAADSKSYFFGPRLPNFPGAVAFFRLLKKSPRFGMGIAAPFFVVWVFAMHHPLDGARLKIVRAQEHIDALKAEVRMYLNERPYNVLTEHDSNLWTFRPVVSVEPPTRLSAIIGDCLTNAMAALDYTIWQLALKYFDDPPLIFDEDRFWVSFPLYRDRTLPGYLNKINRLTNRKIPAGAITEIHATQPDNIGYGPLWWLYELVGADKHRLPLVTFAHLSGAEMRVFKEISGVFTALGHSVGASSFSLTDSTFVTEDPSIGHQMHVDCQAAVFVALQDVTVPRMPVDAALQQIVKCVANTVVRFDQFFV